MLYFDWHMAEQVVRLREEEIRRRQRRATLARSAAIAKAGRGRRASAPRDASIAADLR